MLNTVGACLIFFSFTSIGVLKARELKNEHALTLSFVQALAYTRREITQNHRSLPEILLALSEKEYTSVGRYFKKLHSSLDDTNSFREKWAESIQYQKELPVPLLQIIAPLGGILGQYDCSKQGESISQILEQLNQLKTTQEEDMKRLSKVYVISGMTFGLFFVILMI